MLKWYRTIIIALAAILTALPIFINLGAKPIRLFDESRLAVNAYEMHKSGEVIVTTFDGRPDMWNTKPPLLIWIQALLMNMIGANEWAVRVPSALAAFFTCLVLLFITFKYARDPLPGMIGSLVLVTSLGFMEQHCARTGDYDALMTLFIFLYGITFFMFTENGRVKYLYFTFIFVALAVLTKGVAGLMMLPGMLVYALVRKKVMVLLKSRHFYIGLIIMVVLIGWYYLARELKNPGYLDAMAGNELWGRYLHPVEQGDKGYWYYFDEIRKFYFRHWLLWLIPAFIASLFSNEKVLRRMAVYSALMALLFFTVITLSKTRHYWYPMPMYPFLAVIIGTGIYTVLKKITSLRIFKRNWVSYLFILFILVAVFYEPYRQIVTRQVQADEYGWEAERYHHVYYLRDALRGGADLEGVEYVTTDYRANAWFYIHQMQDRGVHITITRSINEAAFTGRVMAFQEEVKQHINEKYTFEVTDTFFNVTIFDIHGRKENY